MESPHNQSVRAWPPSCYKRPEARTSTTNPPIWFIAGPIICLPASSITVPMASFGAATMLVVLVLLLSLPCSLTEAARFPFGTVEGSKAAAEGSTHKLQPGDVGAEMKWTKGRKRTAEYAWLDSRRVSPGGPDPQHHDQPPY